MSTLNIALVGKGYSMATFLAFAPWDHYLEYAKKFGLDINIDIYGKTDPWDAHVRGTGIVNHAEYMWSRALSSAKHPKPSNRETLKKQNASIFEYFENHFGESDSPKIAIKIIDKLIDSILVNDIDKIKFADEGLPEREFTVDVSEKKYHLIVYGGGAGPARSTKTLASWKEGYISLDEFMVNEKNKYDIKGQTIALQGENAGVDAAVEAIKRGAKKLIWIMSPGKKPVWLNTHHYHIDKDGTNWVGTKENEDELKKIKVDAKLSFDIKYETYRNLTDDEIKTKFSDERLTQVIVQLRVNDRACFKWLKNKCEECLVFFDRDAFSLTNSNDKIEIKRFTQNQIANKKFEKDYDKLEKKQKEAVDDILKRKLSVYSSEQNETTSKTSFTENVTLHIYAIGQNADGVNGPGKALSNLNKNLRPIFDRNQHFGDVLDTVVGLKTCNSSLYFSAKQESPDKYSDKRAPHGLFLIGAAIPAVSPSIKCPEAKIDASENIKWFKEAGIELTQATDVDVDSLVAGMPAKLHQQTVLAAAQLGAIRGQLQAWLAPDIRSYWLIPAGLLSTLNHLKDLSAAATNDKYTYEYKSDEKSDKDATFNTLLKTITDSFIYFKDFIKKSPKHPLTSSLGIEHIDQLIDTFSPHTKQTTTGTTFTITFPKDAIAKINGYIATLQGFIDESINFNGLDSSSIYIILDARFMYLTDNQLERYSNWIRKQAGNDPWGIDFYTTQEILEELSVINDYNDPSSGEKVTISKKKYKTRRRGRRRGAK